ncbi:cupin domain-containing protein [Actinosynnema sp. CA-299493]|uniref:Cupin domain n=1 Tax=Saccharothrix texasensis TaxID=103734 RepID=A0A3N1GY85_9PSEU|nr:MULTISPECIES: cupin domain-containing protein [Saccharothrix]QQQ79651.1 cupin domain-containing protein [Saccharothrix sp. 6-C]ROP35198.1 cupin domain [Saccharothrix texasensis]
MEVIKRGTLPTIQMDGEVAAYIFDGRSHGNLESSAFIVDVPVGRGPGLHTHPYDEIFVVVEGTVRLEADGETVEATPEEICVVRAGVPHAFTNVGPGRARMVNVHAAADVSTEFVQDGRPGDPTYRYNVR